MDAANTEPPEVGDADVIGDARAFMAMCNTADGANREAALDDLEFLSGDQWDERVKRQREIDGRPCLTINKLPTFLHQVTNDQRMNVPSIHVSPVDGGADVKTAEVIQGYIRHAEYVSNADVAYDTAVNSAAAIGFGYFRLVTEFCSPDSFDQDIRFKRIRNAFTVYFDPTSQEADGSDQRRCLITERLLKKDFERQFPGKQTSGDALGTVGAGDPTNKDWFGVDFVRVAEFYRIEEAHAVLVELTNGEVGYEADLLALPEGVTVKRKRDSSRPKVMWYKLTAFEVLDKTEILCPWIPVFPVYGDEIDVDGVVTRSGIIRNAKDPARMYNFWMTAATEEVALRPKTPYIGAEGQFEGYEDDWNDANVKSFSYLEYKPVTLDGQLAPAPARQPMADMPSGMLTMAMHANDNIKATTGLFDSSLGALGNARSGVQERSQQRQGDMANYHFTDNLNRSIRQAARCFIKMVPGYLDADRILRCMGEDGTVKPVRVNAPGPQPDVQQPGAAPAPAAPTGQMPAGYAPLPGTAPEDDMMQAVQTVLHDLTVGEYDVVVKAGPAYSTLREEAAEAMIALGAKWPKLMDVAGDKVVRAMDWPGAEEIADRIAKTIPPELREDQDGQQPQAPMVQTPKGPIPVEQAGQMLQEMDQQMQAMHQKLQEAQAGIDRANITAQAAVEKANIDAAARVHVAEVNATASNDVAELRGLVDLLLAKLAPPPALAQDVAQDLAEDDVSARNPPTAPA